MTEHLWVVEVLNDIENYAEKNNLPSLQGSVQLAVETWSQSPEGRQLVLQHRGIPTLDTGAGIQLEKL